MRVAEGRRAGATTAPSAANHWPAAPGGDAGVVRSVWLRVGVGSRCAAALLLRGAPAPMACVRCSIGRLANPHGGPDCACSEEIALSDGAICLQERIRGGQDRSDLDRWTDRKDTAASVK